MADETIPETFPVSKLGEYQILEDIAEGTFGIVKMAKHTITGHIVAMKFLSKAIIQKTKTKHRVQREVEYMRALRHPHIIKLYEVISTPTDIIIVLEYAKGELFRYIVKNGRLPEDLARRFFQQLISGIQYSHNLKIVHRDLKPENVLLDDDLNVKIADFGLSNEIQDGAFLKTSCGSPNYAAPEVIRAGLYTGPEIDVWSCGVILYVMLCGALPFEDEDVKRLFDKITRGVFHLPSYLSHDARDLVTAMLVVDPISRITLPQITRHPFFTSGLPRYLTPAPPLPGPLLGHLSTLVAPPSNPVNFEVIEGIGKIEDDIIDDLASRMPEVSKQDIWDALRREDLYGAQGNAVKVAYMLLRDKRRAGKSLEDYEEGERDALLAARDPRNIMSPGAVSPGGTHELEKDPFNEGFANKNGSDEEEEYSDELDFDPVEFEEDTVVEEEEDEAPSSSNFAVLNTSLPAPHHLASYASAKARSPALKMKKTKVTKWHFGIRSRSPPMEVMLEIYRTLKALGMEWKEKKDLGGLGGGRGRKGSKIGIERAAEMDGHGEVNLRAAKEIYFVETRARIQDVVVMMNLQLYMVDSINFLVDFHHKKSYLASTEPGAGPFDMAKPKDVDAHANTSEFVMNGKGAEVEEESVVSPFVFMDCACRLILELAGGGQS